MLDFISADYPEILEEFIQPEVVQKKETEQLPSLDLIQALVSWDKKAKRLKDFEYRFMADLANGIQPLTQRNLQKASWNVQKAKRFGFQP